MTKTTKKTNQHLKIPPVLERIALVRQRMQGTDRDDQLDEIDQWEARAKKSLILLSLQGHEGIDMIMEKAKDTIRECQKRLKEQRPRDMGEKSAVQYALDREFIFQQIDLWSWFLTIFIDAKEDVEIIQRELDVQDTTDDEEEDNWG